MKNRFLFICLICCGSQLSAEFISYSQKIMFTSCFITVSVRLEVLIFLSMGSFDWIRCLWNT